MIQKILITITIVALTTVTFAQNSTDSDTAYTRVERMPAWQGCENLATEMERTQCTYDKIVDYLVNNVQYPDGAKKRNETGTSFIKFIIRPDGAIDSVNVVKSVSPELDAESVRVVNGMPAWVAGEQDGRKVSVYYVLPIKYTLQGKEKSKKK